MVSQENPITDCRSAAASPTVQELVSQLRSSFFATEFENVAKILAEREERMNEKCIELGKKAESVVREKGLLVLKNSKLTDELNKKQKEFDVLKKENLKYEDQIKVLDSEKCEKILALEDELKQKQKELDAARILNVEYLTTIGGIKSEKDRMEAELKAYKNQFLGSADRAISFQRTFSGLKSENDRRDAGFEAYKNHFLELDDRVLSLERAPKALMGSGGTSGINMGNEDQKNQWAAEGRRARSSGEKGGSNRKTELKFQEIIQIDDSDDDVERDTTLKRKRFSNEIKREFSDDHVDNVPTGTQKRKDLQDSHNQHLVSHPVSIGHSLKRASDEIKQEFSDDYVDNVPTGAQKRKDLQDSHNQPIASHPLSMSYSPRLFDISTLSSLLGEIKKGARKPKS